MAGKLDTDNGARRGNALAFDLRLVHCYQVTTPAPRVHNATADTKPGSTDAPFMLLREIVAFVAERRAIDRLQITDVYLSGFFSAIQLSDAAVGAAMSYFGDIAPTELAATRNSLVALCTEQPLLDKLLWERDAATPLVWNLRSCLASALSFPLLRSSADFTLEPGPFRPRWNGLSSATVVGFGGFLDYIIRRTAIPVVHVCDLGYRGRQREMDSAIDAYGRAFPFKAITISDGSDRRLRLGSADIVTITGSAFCNGTMDELIELSAGARELMVQGQSASMFPMPLFDRGVTAVVTTLKPPNLIETATTRFSRFHHLLESGLPEIVMRPRAPRARATCRQNQTS